MGHGEIGQLVEGDRTLLDPARPGQHLARDRLDSPDETVVRWRGQEIQGLELSVLELGRGRLNLAELVRSER
jgi:hypothetical protein